MAVMRYGMKEVANVIFFDIATNKPVLFFDTLKVSTIENKSESAEIRGGQGNNRLMAFDYGRTATLTMQDALLSDNSLASLAGTAVKQTGISAVAREVATVATDGTGSKVTALQTPVGLSSITVYIYANGVLGQELTGFTLSAKDIKFATTPVGVTNGTTQVMIFYTYSVVDNSATQITFTGSAFPAIYKVVGDTVVRGEDGIDRKMQFVIPKAKMQSNFTLTMDAENVSTFDFTLDILTEAGTNRLYDIIRLG